VLHELIGTILGTKSAPLATAAGQALAAGTPFDARRLALFETLAATLRAMPLMQKPSPTTTVSPARYGPCASGDVHRLRSTSLYRWKRETVSIGHERRIIYTDLDRVIEQMKACNAFEKSLKQYQLLNLSDLVTGSQ